MIRHASWDLLSELRWLPLYFNPIITFTLYYNASEVRFFSHLINIVNKVFYSDGREFSLSFQVDYIELIIKIYLPFIVA